MKLEFAVGTTSQQDRQHASCCGSDGASDVSSVLSFAGSCSRTKKAPQQSVSISSSTDVFGKVFSQWVARGLSGFVADLTQELQNPQPKEGSENVEVESPTQAVSSRVEEALDQMADFLRAVQEQVVPCLPATDTYQALEAAFSAVKHRAQHIVFWAAQDDDRQWTFRGYVGLVQALLKLIASAELLGIQSGPLAELEADLQVLVLAVNAHLSAARCTTAALKGFMRAQIVYSRAGNLAQQFLLLAIDGATAGGMKSLMVENEDSVAICPDCIELLRMMHEQVR
jgi:hypothetical protein